jgi:hypothetical protein
MCCRYRLSRRKQLVEEYFDCGSEEPDWTPRYNIAPTQPVPVIRQNPKEPVRELALMRWGLIPYLDVAGSLDRECGKISLFVLNRDLSSAHDVELVWEDKAPSNVLSSWLLTGDNLKASNSFAAPQRVAPQAFAKLLPVDHASDSKLRRVLTA